MSQNHDRFYYLDYARAFFILLVVFDHTVHMYSESFARFWFMQDSERDMFWDGVHLLNYAVMIPGLFFVAGVFTPVSLQRRGFWSYAQERVVKLLIPFAVGVATVSPFLVYFKEQFKGHAQNGFWDYYLHTYFHKDIALCGFWFLSYLFVFTTVYLLCSRLLPFIPKLLKTIAEKMEQCPTSAYWVGSVVLAIVFALSNLRFGAFYWIGYKHFFSAIASFVGCYILLFALGIGVGLAHTFQNRKLLESLSNNLTKILGLTALWCILYLIISLGYMSEGSFNDDVPIYFFRGGSWKDVGPLLAGSHLVWIRGALHGFVTWGLLVSTLGVLYKYKNQPSTFWQSMAANSFVIYIIHEPFVLWQHKLFMDTPVPLMMRVVFIAMTSLGISWVLSEKVLRKIGFIRRVVG